jgi:hypothetical protein
MKDLRLVGVAVGPVFLAGGGWLAKRLFTAPTSLDSAPRGAGANVTLPAGASTATPGTASSGSDRS